MDKRILFTAGAGRIGLAIAQKFAAEGAAVHVIDIDAKAVEIATRTDGITSSVADISDEGAVSQAVLAGRAAASGATVDEERAKAYRNQSVQRFVEASEIAELAYFLAGPAARSISGQTFPIDGDSRSSV